MSGHCWSAWLNLLGLEVFVPPGRTFRFDAAHRTPYDRAVKPK